MNAIELLDTSSRQHSHVGFVWDLCGPTMRMQNRCADDGR
ncbi:hypothetical protein IMCC9480_448 [Oxalobacteraceae bacterium IMCC9480]|nr:hypothetical protein IMCC9480_448 [Oxalobacteraceae bacterium IMCC9480]